MFKQLLKKLTTALIFWRKKEEQASTSGRAVVVEVNGKPVTLKPLKARNFGRVMAVSGTLMNAIRSAYTTPNVDMSALLVAATSELYDEVLEALVISTDLTKAELADATPFELVDLLTEFVKVNRFAEVYAKTKRLSASIAEGVALGIAESGQQAQ